MVKLLILSNLEYAEAILNSPDFLNKLKHHENYIEKTIKNAEELLKKCKSVAASESESQKQQTFFSDFLKKFTIGIPFWISKEVEKYLNEIINLFNDQIKTFDMKILKDLFENLKKGLPSLKRDYEKQTKEYLKQLEKYLKDNTGKIKDDDVVKENLKFQKKCLEYVFEIEQLENSWLLCFLHHIIMLAKSWLAEYSKNMNDDFKKYTNPFDEIAAILDGKEKTPLDEKMKILKDPKEYITRASQNEPNGTKIKQGYLNVLTEESSTMHFCKFFPEYKKFQILAYDQLTRPEINIENTAEEFKLENCEKTKKKFVIRLSCLPLLSDSHYVCFTVQALSNEDYESWFSVFSGKKFPQCTLDEIGLEFIKKCIEMIENGNGINKVRIYQTNCSTREKDVLEFIDKNHNRDNKPTTSASSLKASNSNSSISSDSFDEYVDVITCALRYFLRNCKEPLIPKMYTEKLFKENRNGKEAEKLKKINELLLKFPKINLEVLKRLMGHFYKVSNASDMNRMTISELAKNFSPFLYDAKDKNLRFDKESAHDSVQICEYLIRNHHIIFDSPIDNNNRSATASSSGLNKNPKGSKSKNFVSVEYCIDSENYPLDEQGFAFIKECITMIEDNITKEGIYRQIGNIGDINKYFENNYKNKQTKGIKESKSNSSISKINSNNNYVDFRVVTSALKKFIKNCEEIHIPERLNELLLEANLIEDENEKLIKIKNLLSEMPKLGLDALELLMRHLHKVSNQSAANKMTAHNLSILFTPNLFVVNINNLEELYLICEFLIKNHEKIFPKNPEMEPEKSGMAKRSSFTDSVKRFDMNPGKNNE